MYNISKDQSKAKMTASLQESKSKHTSVNDINLDKQDKTVRTFSAYTKIFLLTTKQQTNRQTDR